MAGESIAAELAFTDYPSSSGWVVAYSFGNGRSRATVTCTAHAGATTHDFLLTSTASAALTPGTYAFTAKATLGSVCKAVDSGVLRINADPAIATAAQTRLAAIDAILDGRATSDQLTISFDGVSLSYANLDQLRAWRAELVREVAAEQRAAAIAAGTEPSNFVFTQFRRAM